MRIQNQVIEGQEKDNEILFILGAEDARPNGTPAKKMITDSDELSFVYLMDIEEGYAYIHFPKVIWPYMQKALQTGNDPSLLWNDETIPLPGFVEELTMLVYNIEGNDNYGEAFTTAVEQEFEAFLQNINE
ncbi:hypothetical protein MHZ92_10845 [Sporosarcina sp. ACRSL]|uniref:UPF0738 family protein n=1 Tax=Sporosarcina sp. ACRSL TaxID=2918215 RepID=UPI001EF6EDE7|nr:hypothetical protein [Sporosarcina sp. ACRSL]MCG7344636.1 hypothetical protein [Sporosarcina sp. ACRSL]